MPDGIGVYNQLLSVLKTQTLTQNIFWKPGVSLKFNLQNGCPNFGISQEQLDILFLWHFAPRNNISELVKARIPAWVDYALDKYNGLNGPIGYDDIIKLAHSDPKALCFELNGSFKFKSGRRPYLNGMSVSDDLPIMKSVLPIADFKHEVLAHDNNLILICNIPSLEMFRTGRWILAVYLMYLDMLLIKYPLYMFAEAYFSIDFAYIHAEDIEEIKEFIASQTIT